MKQNSAEDRKICAVTGHKNIASLSSYDIVTSHEAGILADAIDLKPPSYEGACPEAPVATAVREPAFAAVDTDSLDAASACTGTGFMLHAAGASFSNVTFDVMPRLSLNRKRCREQKAAFAKPKRYWLNGLNSNPNGRPFGPTGKDSTWRYYDNQVQLIDVSRNK